MAGRLRVHTEKNRNALTLPDYFTYRFEDKSRVLRILSALVILLFFTIYCASGVVAGARLFESTFGMSYDTALWIGAAATITYTFFGGFLAVSWTDTVQATLMIFALILTPVFVIIAVGGIDTAMVQVAAQNASNLDMFKNLDFIAIISPDGLGPGLLRSAPHPGALHGGGLPPLHGQRPSHQHDLDGALPGRCRGHRFLRPLLLLHLHRAGGRRDRQPGARLHRALQDPVQPLDCRRAALRHPGGGHEYPQLPVAGLLQRHHRGSLQSPSCARTPPRKSWCGSAAPWCC